MSGRTCRLGLAGVALVAVVLTSCAASDVVVLAQGPASDAAVRRDRTSTSRASTSRTSTTAAAPTTAAPTTTAPTTVPGPTTTLLGTVPARLDHLPASTRPRPVALRIDPAGIAGPIQPVGIVPETGELAVPPVAGVVGWYQYGPSPGQGGSAVLAGHVDWHGAMGVFFTLSKVEAGAIVSVGYDDGTARAFTVVERRLVLKPELPVESVFARGGPPSLVLVTCGGEFDRSRHRYRSNVIVVATPVP